MPWFKGNLHTHTNKSDGDSSPEVVISWYKKNKYDFLVLSDHNHLTILKNNNTDLLLIPGEEITLNFPHAIHINAIGIKRLIEPTLKTSKIKTIQANIDNIIEAGGLAEINHPNFRWAITGDELTKIKGAHFLEVFNGNYNTHSYGGGGKKSVEEMWDQMLTEKIKIWGVAVDDSHHFTGEFSATRHNPGRGWIVVFAKKLTSESILKSLRNGDFYFSTGVKLNEISFSDNEISIVISGDEVNPGIANSFITDSKYTSQLITNNGEVLDEKYGKKIKFKLPTLKEEYKYFRTKITSSTGSIAWSQPIFFN